MSNPGPYRGRCVNVDAALVFVLVFITVAQQGGLMVVLGQ